jgi:Ca2+-binding EF-hand superfamily protein
VNIINILMDPKLLRQRAEMIAAEELSVESILRDLNTTKLDFKLKILFNTYDTNKSGELDAQEFRRCLLSLELGVDQKLIDSLTSAVDNFDGMSDGQITFEGFKRFFHEYVPKLEKEKEMRALQYRGDLKNFQVAGHTEAESTGLLTAFKGESVADEERHTLEHLMTAFRSMDPRNQGYVPYEEVEVMLKSLITGEHLSLTDLEIKMILSDIHVEGEVEIEYHTAAPVLARLLMVSYRRK